MVKITGVEYFAWLKGPLSTTARCRSCIAAFMLAHLLFTPPVLAKTKESATIKVENAKNMAGISNVIIASFSIAFVTEKSDAAFAGARNNFKAMGAITKARLEGISAEDFQAITDAAYEDFVVKITAAGYSIVDRSAMIRDKQMAKIQYLPSGAEGSLVFGKDSKAKARFFGPTAFGEWAIMKGETGEATAAAGGSVFGAFKAISAMGGPTTAKIYYSIYNGQPTISVAYVVDFASVERYGGRYAVQATVGLDASLAVVDAISVVTTTSAKGATATATVAQPIAVAGNFGRLQDTTTGGQTASNVAGALIGGLFGSGSNSYKYVTFTAQPATYRAGAIEAAKSATALIVPEIAARR